MCLLMFPPWKLPGEKVKRGEIANPNGLTPLPEMGVLFNWSTRALKERALEGANWEPRFPICFNTTQIKAKKRQAHVPRKRYDSFPATISMPNPFSFNGHFSELLHCGNASCRNHGCKPE
jgi:hypothetical protein